jgi:hypothetical protein
MAEDIRVQLHRAAFGPLHERSTVLLCAGIDEIERLRATLESLTKDPPPTLDEPDTDAEVIIKMRQIARDALA